MSTADELLSHPIGAPEGMTYLDMYETGLDAMIETNTMVGCEIFEQTPVVQRVAISKDYLGLFDREELEYLLSIALDRLSEGALSGQIAYRSKQSGQPG